MGTGTSAPEPILDTDKVHQPRRRPGKRTVLSDDNLMGVRKPDHAGAKPLKVRLPLGHVLQLHRMRIVGDRSVSEIVETALEEYLAGLQLEAKAASKSPPNES